MIYPARESPSDSVRAENALKHQFPFTPEKAQFRETADRRMQKPLELREKGSLEQKMCEMFFETRNNLNYL